jgi:hypothetical protein
MVQRRCRERGPGHPDYAWGFEKRTSLKRNLTRMEALAEIIERHRPAPGDPGDPGYAWGFWKRTSLERCLTRMEGHGGWEAVGDVIQRCCSGPGSPGYGNGPSGLQRSRQRTSFDRCLNRCLNRCLIEAKTVSGGEAQSRLLQRYCPGPGFLSE